MALGEDGRPVFQLLQQSRRNRAPVLIYVFDLLNYSGHDLKELPLHTRRTALEALANSLPQHVRLSELLSEAVPVAQLVQVLEEHKLETREIHTCG